jgi:hypothetical protein
MGGMGILSHRECSSHARAAAEESADLLLKDVLDEGMEDGATDEVRSQGNRCKEMLLARRDELHVKLRNKAKKGMRENAGAIGRKWLTTTPYNKTGEIDNFEISANLHYRTLIPPSGPCPYCQLPNDFGHDEVCRGEKRPRFTIIRHNGIVNAVADAIRTLGVVVQVEPPTTDHGSRRRNDVLVWGSSESGQETAEYDVKVYSILGDKVHIADPKARSGDPHAPPPDLCPWDKTAWQLQRYLKSVHDETKRNVAGGMGKFAPLVFSAGGMMEAETRRVMAGWRDAVGDVVWEYTTRRMSMGLMRARAKTWLAGGG